MTDKEELVLKIIRKFKTKYIRDKHNFYFLKNNLEDLDIEVLMVLDEHIKDGSA